MGRHSTAPLTNIDLGPIDFGSRVRDLDLACSIGGRVDLNKKEIFDKNLGACRSPPPLGERSGVCVWLGAIQGACSMHHVLCPSGQEDSFFIFPTQGALPIFSKCFTNSSFHESTQLTERFLSLRSESRQLKSKVLNNLRVPLSEQSITLIEQKIPSKPVPDRSINVIAWPRKLLPSVGEIRELRRQILLAGPV